MSETGRALLLTGAVIVIVMVAVWALVLLRRRLLGFGADHGRGEILSLHQIRAMRQRGQINEAEFVRLKAVALARWGASAADGAWPVDDAGPDGPASITPENH